jgi:CheY-like chemotaxis protein
VLRALKNMGVRLEVDDFGTGYSSLSYLRQLPLDAVKIDRSFVSNLADTNTTAIVRAAIDLSHALGLEAVAEGVEDEATLARLAQKGCDAAQGFFIARPMPAHEVPSWAAAAFGETRAEQVVAMPATIVSGRGTILLIDDEHRFRLSAHRMLTADGYRVIAAATASEALQLFAENRSEIDLVLTDMHLTDWAGDELAARLREGHPDLRIMFMSGDERERAKVVGDLFLAKPFSRSQLVTGVQQALAA